MENWCLLDSTGELWFLPNRVLMFKHFRVAQQNEWMETHDPRLALNISV